MSRRPPPPNQGVARPSGLRRTRCPQAPEVAVKMTAKVVTVTDALGRVTVDGYNGYRVLAVQSDAAGTSQRAYDGYLNWNATTDANGHTTRYIYNRMGQPEWVEPKPLEDLHICMVRPANR